MAIDFPTSPTTGQTVYLAGNAYTWNGTVWTTSTGKAAAIRQVFTAGAGQTSYTVTGGYFAGTIDVYLNGVKLVSGDDFTATDGSVVTLATGATAGDILEVVSFNSFSVANMLPLSGGTLTGGLAGTTAAFTGAVSGATIADSTGTFRRMVTGTAVATTSGTAVNISTSIPSWVQRIQVALRGVSTSGITDLLVQIGSGSFQTTGYVSTSAYGAQTNAAGATSSTAGFNFTFGNAAQLASGIMTLVHMGSNVWVGSHAGKITTLIGVMGGGDVALSGVLDRIRITTANGTDVFDAGSVNILYEG